MDSLPSNHLLSLPRPDGRVGLGGPAGIVDTTTLASHDFDVDTRTGFMPPQVPLTRLPEEWDTWENILKVALSSKLQLGDKTLTAHEEELSESWRLSVRQMPVLDIANLKVSEVLLRRAHAVLGWIMHMFIHTLPPHMPITIPRTITIPHLQVCAQLQLPPVLTFSDDVLYNWDLKEPSDSPTPALDNLKSQLLFTGTGDEEEFYLTSARIELRGVEALELMQATMDEAFVGDQIANRRITAYLHRMATVIHELQDILVSVKDGCDPDVFYRDIRPWFRGEDSDPTGRRWVFEGIEEDSSLSYPTELSGPSAGQSSLVHSLDIFLGVEQYTPADVPTPKPSFMKRMQSYMPRHHRQFLNHLSSNPRPLRTLVMISRDPKLLDAYNSAVQALKEFRDAHMIVVALFIVGPARRHATAIADQRQPQDVGPNPKTLKGTGGSDLIKFLKGTRALTAGAVLSSP